MSLERICPSALLTIVPQPILFTEVGYESMTDTAMHPWNSQGTLDLTVHCYPYPHRMQLLTSSDPSIGSIELLHCTLSNGLQ